MSKIEYSNFKMIESELYFYKESKKELELLEEEILEGSTYQEVAVQTGTTGDTTANKAIKLVSSREILEIKRRLGAIDKTIEILKFKDKDKLRLLEMKYFERKYTDQGIANELHIDTTTVWRWKKEIVRLIAGYLGCRI